MWGYGISPPFLKSVTSLFHSRQHLSLTSLGATIVYVPGSAFLAQNAKDYARGIARIGSNFLLLVSGTGGLDFAKGVGKGEVLICFVGRR